MSNIEVYAPLVNGGVMPYHEKREGCNIFIENLLGDDMRPPARSLVFKLETEEGKVIELVIPNDLTTAVVLIDGERVK